MSSKRDPPEIRENRNYYTRNPFRLSLTRVLWPRHTMSRRSHLVSRCNLKSSLNGHVPIDTVADDIHALRKCCRQDQCLHQTCDEIARLNNGKTEKVTVLVDIENGPSALGTVYT